jgi:hypothetical protein
MVQLLYFVDRHMFIGINCCESLDFLCRKKGASLQRIHAIFSNAGWLQRSCILTERRSFY